MIKKLAKYGKILMALTLIMALTLPSYATVGASDGSAFVTKAEFDAALSDFNARLTTFEAGINSKIDSQVSSYLDRNGIWQGKAQDIVPKKGIYLLVRQPWNDAQWEDFTNEGSTTYIGQTWENDAYWRIFVEKTIDVMYNGNLVVSDRPGYFGTGYMYSHKLFEANKTGLCVLTVKYGYRSMSANHFKMNVIINNGTNKATTINANDEKKYNFPPGRPYSYGLSSFSRILETTDLSTINLFSSRAADSDCIKTLPKNTLSLATRELSMASIDRYMNGGSNFDGEEYGSYSISPYAFPANSASVIDYTEQFFVQKGKAYHFAYETQSFTEGIDSEKVFVYACTSANRGGLKYMFPEAKVY